MCEFTVRRKNGSDIETIGEDIIFFQYDNSGKARLADILGRSIAFSPNSIVYEINMLENRHDITLIESDLVPLFVQFLDKINSNNREDAKHIAKQLIEGINNQLV